MAAESADQSAFPATWIEVAKRYRDDQDTALDLEEGKVADRDLHPQFIGQLLEFDLATRSMAAIEKYSFHKSGL